MCIVGCAAALL